MTADLSGDWLCRLSSRWPILALGYRYEIQLGKMLDEKRISGFHLKPYLRNVDVQWGRINTDELPTMDFDSDAQLKYSLRSGDILVCEGGEVGRAAVWDKDNAEPVFFQKALHRLRPLDPEHENTAYMYYALRAAADLNAYDSGGKATIAHLPADAFRRVRFPKPPIAEQVRIANFLDVQTARIDALIAQKETLRTTVQEFFGARLGTAVVEGLINGRRCIPAADKGFESVPEDWDLVPLKHLATSSGGMTPSKDKDEFWVGDIPWVSPKDMKRFVLHDSTDHISQAALDSTSLRLNPVDSVLVVVRGMILAHTFPVAMNAVPVTINQDMKALRPNSRITAKYLAWLLRGLQPLMLSLTEESAHGTKALRTDQWANQCVPLPPLKEQAALVAAFESWEAESTALVSHLGDHLDRLREYRSSLISAAVTGQLDISTFELKEAA